MLNSIPFDSIVVENRARTTLRNIDLLADSIKDTGLQCPIILSPLPDGKFKLEDGGRRHAALTLLGVTQLFHATTGDPLRPGYVLKSELSSEAVSSLTELVANLHREDFDWKDSVPLIVKAYRQEQKAAGQRGEPLYMRVFGQMVGLPYADINAAIQIADELAAHPEKFAGCVGIHQAYGVLLNESRKQVEAELAARRTATVIVRPPPAISIAGEAPPLVVKADDQLSRIDLSPFMQGNSLDYLESDACPVFDHIICDPDFAISVDRLESNSSVAGLGVVQDSVEDSLNDLRRLICAAHTKTAPNGFLIFWYDLDHHEKLQRWCRGADWLVQRWPIIWHKVGFASNGAPQYNTAKNIEYVMVCRKPGATLSRVTPTSVITCALGTTADKLGHPFAKPEAVWHKLFDLCATTGQTVFDPFMGSGSMPLAALSYGLKPSGMELNPDHYNRAIVNLSDAHLH